MPVSWNGLPPSTPRLQPDIPIFSVPAGGQAFLRCLADAQGVWVHWVENRSTPCLGDECCWCPSVPQRWKGYVPALLWRVTHDPQRGHVGRWTPVVLEITEGIADQLGGNLRGKILDLSRPGQRRNSPLRVVFLEQTRSVNDDNTVARATKVAALRAAQAELPPAFDVRPILERVWGLHRARQRVPEPAPEASAEPSPFIPFPAGGNPQKRQKRVN
jgi:hypothetical protein